MPSESKRKLAAILFADIVGYTSMMQKDGMEASILLRHFQTLLEEKVAAHNGHIVNFYGDGALCTFQIPIDAVRCAMDLQTIYRADPAVPVRIGIHSGTVTIEGGKIFGDSVNITSRVESIGVAGGILLSKKVRDDVKNTSDLQIQSLGSYQFKNVDEPLEVFAIANDGFIVPNRKQLLGKLEKLDHRRNAKGIMLVVSILIIIVALWYGMKGRITTENTGDKSIAVLAFEDMSHQKDQEYFSDGIAEEILNALSKLEGLKVAGRISSFSFKDKKDVSLDQIGDQLHVSTILNGSVRRNGNRLRITANLINASDGFQIWSETYDEEMEDIFEIQERIAQNIVRKFRLSQSIGSTQNLLTKQTSNLEAYEKYLEGNFYFNKTSDGLEDARTAYEKAIQLDSNYVQAYNGLSITYLFLAVYNLAPKKEFYEKSRSTIMKAMAIDPENAQAFEQLAAINFVADYDWDSTMTNFARANVLSKQRNSYHNIFNSRMFNAIVHPTLRNQALRIDSYEAQLKDDPLSVDALLMVNRAYLDAKQYGKVIRNSEKIFKLDPEQRSAMRHIGEAYMFSGHPEESLPYFERAITKNNYAFYNYITNLVQLDRKEEAKTKFEEKKVELDAYAKSLSLIALGALDSAFVYLDIAYQEKHPMLVFYKVTPHFDPIKQDSRFKAFEAKMNFPKELKD